MAIQKRRGKTIGRRQKFAAACALAGIRQEDWAKSEGDVSPEHLSMVLNGHRESAILIDKVDAFIAKHLPAHTSAAI